MTVYDEAIDKLIEKYQRQPDSYFSECELQYDLYCICKSYPSLGGSFATSDNFEAGLVHPEYPSVNRIKLDKSKGYRVWFDLAILNKEFITNNEYKAVWARDERVATMWGKNVSAAFEFKYFTRRQTSNLIFAQTDCQKLELCSEVADKYVLVFSKYEVDESELAVMNIYSSNMYWVTPTRVIKLKA